MRDPDYVLTLVFDGLRNKNAVVDYAPDHGEEVYDYRDNMGRKGDKVNVRERMKCQNEIPFEIWCSPKYQELHPSAINRIKQSLNVPFTNDAVSHLLLSLGGIKTSYYRSICNAISPSFNRVQRKVEEGDKYD